MKSTCTGWSFRICCNHWHQCARPRWQGADGATASGSARPPPTGRDPHGLRSCPRPIGSGVRSCSCLGMARCGVCWRVVCWRAGTCWVTLLFCRAGARRTKIGVWSAMDLAPAAKGHPRFSGTRSPNAVWLLVRTSLINAASSASVCPYEGMIRFNPFCHSSARSGKHFTTNFSMMDTAVLAPGDAPNFRPRRSRARCRIPRHRLL